MAEYNLPSSGGTKTQNKRVIVTSAGDLSGELDSSKEYFIDGVIDMGSQSIIVPNGGLSLAGYNFDISKLVSSAENYTMFTSPLGGSGNVIGMDYAVEVSGANSKVYDIVAFSGAEAFEFSRINYNSCASLGKIENYRQGLELGTGRFFGSPSLELIGTWAGGFRITTSIVRALDSGMTAPLFKAGSGFNMQSRFLSDINVDLPPSAALLDFSASNFPNPSTVQLNGCVVTRGGVTNSDDANIIPNMDKGDLSAAWSNNIGMPNTFVGGKLTFTGETETPISSAGAYVDILGTIVSSGLEHFDSPSSGQLRHLGDSPKDFSLVAEFVIDGGSNDEVSIKAVKWDNSLSSFVDVTSIRRVVNNLLGGRNVAFFTLVSNVELDSGDYIKLQIANLTDTTNLTAEIDSYLIVEQR